MFIPDPDLDFLPIPDFGSRGQKGTNNCPICRDPFRALLQVPVLPLISEFRLRNDYPGSGIRIFSNPDPGTQANTQHCVFAARALLQVPTTYQCWGSGCLSRIWIFSIPDPGTQANNCPICRAPFRALLQVPPSYHLPVSCGFGMFIPDPGTQADNCPICRAPFRALLPVLPLTGAADPGCLSRIQDPNFFHPWSLNPGQQLSHLPRWLCCSRYIPLTPSVGDPGCLSRIRIFSILDPGSKRFRIPDQKDLSIYNPRSITAYLSLIVFSYFP